MKQTINLFVIIGTLLSASDILSFNRKDIRSFAQSFVIANLLKRLIKNDNLSNKNKNIFTLCALGGYAFHVHETSPQSEKLRNLLFTAGGLTTGSLAKDTVSLFETLIAGFAAIALINYIFD